MSPVELPAQWALVAERALDDLLRGQMVVLERDALERDLLAAFVVAAEAMTPDHLQFMAHFGGDIVWVALSRSRADFLNLSEIASDRPEAQAPTLVPIDLRGSSGLTLADRAATIRALASAVRGPADFMRPGHVFPVVVDERRALLGQPNIPEAAVGLMRLSGREAVVAGCMLMDGSGRPAGLDEINRIASDHRLTVARTSEAALYSMAVNRLLDPGTVTNLPVPGQEFRVQAFRSTVDGRVCVALVRGEVTAGESVPVYLHRYSTVGDVFRSSACDCFASLERALAELQAMPAGVLVYLVSESAESLGIDHGPGCQRPLSMYETALAAQVLRGLGPRSVALATPELADPATLQTLMAAASLRPALSSGIGI